MENRSDKELAIETALEYVKSWNSAGNTQAIKPDRFLEILNDTYDAIKALDSR